MDLNKLKKRHASILEKIEQRIKFIKKDRGKGTIRFTNIPSFLNISNNIKKFEIDYIQFNTSKSKGKAALRLDFHSNLSTKNIISKFSNYHFKYITKPKPEPKSPNRSKSNVNSINLTKLFIKLQAFQNQKKLKPLNKTINIKIKGIRNQLT